MATPTPSFRGAELSAYPNPNVLRKNDLAVVLWILWVAKDALDLDTLSPAEVAAFSRDDLGINLTRQRVEGILNGRRDLVARRRIGGRWRYQVMQAGIDHVASAGNGVLLVEPEKAFTQVRAIQDLLEQAGGVVRICDPYFSPRSLDFVVKCTAASEVRILTCQVHNTATFRSDLKAVQSELGVPIDVRVAASNVLHDRYVIDDVGMLILGTSLNGLGNKQSIVVTGGQDLRGMALASFDRVWNSSKPLQKATL